jgi:hypothetical protein
MDCSRGLSGNVRASFLTLPDSVPGRYNQRFQRFAVVWDGRYAYPYLNFDTKLSDSLRFNSLTNPGGHCRSEDSICLKLNDDELVIAIPKQNIRRPDVFPCACDDVVQNIILQRLSMGSA